MPDSPPSRSIAKPPSGRAALPHERPLADVLRADARMAAAYRGDGDQRFSGWQGVRQMLRLMLHSDAFFGLAAYRAGARLRGRGVPVLPWILRRLAMMSARVSIADTVTVQPGVVVPDGRLVVHGEVEIGPFVTVQPWVTIGPTPGGTVGPRIGAGAVIGSGATVMGDVEVGAGARIGTNAVVVDDVAPGTTVAGMPAKPVGD